LIKLKKSYRFKNIKEKQLYIYRMETKFLYGSISIFIVLVLLRVYGFFLLGPTIHDGQYLTITTTVLADAARSGSGYTASVLYSNQWGSVPIFVNMVDSDIFRYGNDVVITGKVRIKTNATGRIIRSINTPKILIKENSNVLVIISRNLRNRLSSFYKNNLPDTSAGLLLGIVLGVKTSVSKEMQVALQNTGTTHIIAASGMNVTLVAGVFNYVSQSIF